MPRKPKAYQALDGAMAEVIASEVRKRGLTLRDLRDATGMSLNRIGLLLRQESAPVTIGEIGLFADLFDVPASQLMERAEAAVSCASSAPPDHRPPSVDMTDAGAGKPPGTGGEWSRPPHAEDRQGARGGRRTRESHR